MDTKPYRLQSPEDIAKDYGGNKQKIAQAMQLGVVDPTAGVLAGMFIDRMRAAQMQEQAPQATVAQQVMGGPPAQAPLAQAGGLGGTQPAMPPMAPQGGAPMAPPPMEAPMQAPPQGMAAGGMFEAPYMAGGGLSELPLPDTMFDEDRDGGYAGGGIVAFANAGLATAPAPDPNEDITLTGQRPPTAPANPLAGLGTTYDEQMALIERFAPQKKKYGTKLIEAIEAEMTPEARKKRKKQDMWESLAELGFGMAASKSPTLLGAIGEAGMRAAPAMAERGKERRTEQREMVKALAAREDVSNKQAMEAFGIASELQKAYAGLLDAKAGRELQEKLAKMDSSTRLLAARIAAGATAAAANAPTGTERILNLALGNDKYKQLIQDLGIYGGNTPTGGAPDGWGTPKVVNP